MFSGTYIGIGAPFVYFAGAFFFEITLGALFSTLIGTLGDRIGVCAAICDINLSASGGRLANIFYKSIGCMVEPKFT